MVAPASRELDANRAERDRLEKELSQTRDKYGAITSTETHVSKLMSSVDEFESYNLPIASNGRTSLYQRINGLISGYGLVNTSGPDYAPLETLDQSKGVESEEERGRAKYKSLFPGVYVTMTVEGNYQNVRRFIREIETARGDFIVISSVELEPSDAEQKPEQQQKNQNPGVAVPSRPTAGVPPGFPNGGPVVSQPSAETARQRGKTHGEVVSLRLEMAAYFRRPNATPTISAPTEQ